MCRKKTCTCSTAGIKRRNLVVDIDSDRRIAYIIRRKILLRKVKYMMSIVGKGKVGQWENIIRNKKVDKVVAYENNGENGGMEIVGLSGAAARTSELKKNVKEITRQQVGGGNKRNPPRKNRKTKKCKQVISRMSRKRILEH